MLSKRELAIVLTGLRTLQQVDQECDGDFPGDLFDILDAGGPSPAELGDPITLQMEIDSLCLKLNQRR